MNFTADLQRCIEQACAWLTTMQIKGGYRRWLRPSADKPGDLPHELGPISAEVTSYAAHLYAWLYMSKAASEHPILEFLDGAMLKASARTSADWIARAWANDKTLWVEPGVCLQYFFDIGIAGRALFAVHEMGRVTEGRQKALDYNDYWETAICMASRMMDFVDLSPGPRGLYHAVLDPEGNAPYASSDQPSASWWSRQPGPHQLRGAILWKMVQRMAAYDDLAMRWFRADPPQEFQPLPERKKMAKAELQQLQDEQRRAVDELHPFAYQLEALFMGESSSARAARALPILTQRMNRCEWMRSDVMAQQIRLNLAMGSQLRVADLHRLMEAQHASGGFHFSIAGREPSPDLSVHATIFAIQALAMAAYPKLARMPGPIGRRDLALV